ncbi:MAG: ISL3-like element IS1557 family transposase [Acidimicrobiales bacterium]
MLEDQGSREADGVRRTRVWARLLGVQGVIVEDVAVEEDGEEDLAAIIISVRLRRSEAGRCGECRRRCPGYDRGTGRRRWRALDLGTVQSFLEAEAPRVNCPTHGVVVAAVPWARHDAGHTRAFDDTAAWLATRTSKSAVVTLLRVAWRTVGRIVTRVSAEATASRDLFANLTRIGIDEVSYKRGHRYLIVVVDHDSGRLLWAAPGRDEATLRTFFDLLGEERCAAITLVSADAAEWIANVVRERCQHATLCLDPFHIVAWATAALDDVRREVWNAARRGGQTVLAKELKGARFALWKNPQNLTARQQNKLADIQRINTRLYRAYLLKEELRLVFQLRGAEGMAMLRHWLAWAQRCRIPAFMKLAASIKAHRVGIDATLTHGLTNARVEAVNTKLRLLMRMAFGFRSADALIGLAMLSLGGLCPPLPGRS